MRNEFNLIKNLTTKLGITLGLVVASVGTYYFCRGEEPSLFKNLLQTVVYAADLAFVGLFVYEAFHDRIVLSASRYEKVAPILPWIIASIGTLVYLSFALIRHYTFRSNGEDLGVYGQTVYLISHGLVPILTTHFKDIHAFANHFEPILYLLSPLYWIHPSPLWLLIAQVLGVTLGVIAIYRIFRLFNPGLLIPTLLSISYLASLGFQNGISFDFHTAVLMPVFLLWLFYYGISRNYVHMWVIAALMLLIKEDASLYLAFFGIYLMIKNRAYKHGIGLILTGLGWLIIVIKVVIPSLNDGKILNLIFDRIGTNLNDIVKSFILHPINAAKIFFDPFWGKIAVIGLTLAHGSILPLWAPWELLLLIPMFLIRFFSSRYDIWSFSMYYSAPAVAVVAAAATIAAGRLLSQNPQRKIWGFPVQSVVFGLALHAALFSIFFGSYGSVPADFSYSIFRQLAQGKFYAPLTDPNVGDIYSALKVIPANGGVCASQSILPHVSSRVRVAMFSNCKPDFEYYVINPTVNNWPMGAKDIAQLITQSQEKGWRPIFSKGLTVVLKKDAPGIPLSAEIKQWLANPT